jgi:2-keto-3-deoxy-6-phosphogluconate aldolase
MGVRSGQITVGTTAVEIPATCSMPFRMQIKNMDASDNIFIGNGEVSTTTGMRLAKEERLELVLAPLDRVSLVSTKPGHQIAYIIFTQAC